MRGKVGFVVAAAFVLVAVSAAAATLALSSSSLGSDARARCIDVASLTVQDHSAGDGTVDRVDVSGLPAACYGSTLSVALVGAGGADLGHGSVTVSGAATSVPVSPNPQAATVSHTAVALSS